MTPDTKDISWKMLGWLLDIIAVSALAFSVSLHSRINSLELWQAETRGNRWDSNMQAQYARGQSEEITKLWNAFSQNQIQLTKDLGDIKGTLSRISTKLDYVGDTIDENKGRIGKLEDRSK